MNYEINVSKNGEHYFATHARSITTLRKLRKMCMDFRERFPASEGFKLTAYYIPGSRETLDVDEVVSETAPRFNR